MKLTRLSLMLALAGLGSAFAPSAFAQDPGLFYGGGSIGQSRANFDQQRTGDAALNGAATTTVTSTDDNETSYKLFGGYQFNRSFAVEAGIFRLGPSRYSSATTPPGTLEGSVRLRGINADLVGTAPLSERLSLLGRIGVQRARANGTFSGTGAAAGVGTTTSSNDTNMKLGIGLQYTFSPTMLVRMEAERYRASDSVGNHGNINAYTIGLVFPFGSSPKPVPRAAAPAPVYVAPAPAPVYVAPAPAPMPAPVVIAPPPAPAPAPAVIVAVAEPRAVVAPRHRVSFSSESLFGFDKSALRPEGKTALDNFANKLQGTDYQALMIEGHTDRLGTTGYNQKLSEQRAESVKSYLMSSGRFQASKISSVGMSEFQPVTKADDCKGNVATPALISCLQPDRRVEIEVTGMR